MSILTRRTLIGALGGMAVLAACSGPDRDDGAARIDARVDSALRYLYANHPETVGLRDKAEGILVMPVVTKAGLLLGGGAYGRGALRVRDVTVDYYSVASATFGPQFGAQQHSHALFFMTEDALQKFRNSPGLAAGSDTEFVLGRQAENISTETTMALNPVIGVIFGQAGLTAGATLKGVKYSRIIP